MDLLVLVPYSEADLAALRNAAGDLRVVCLPEDAPREELRHALEQAKVVIGEPPVDLLQNLPNLEWIQMTWAGADRYTKDENFPRHIRVTNASGVYGVTIAEHILAMMLALNRRLPGYLRQQREGGYKDLGPEIAMENQVAVILGTGDIGLETARRLQVFGVAVIGVRRHKGGLLPGFTHVTTLDELDRILPQADTVIACLPDTPQTRGLMSAERIAQMKQGAIFLNVGRGSLVDTQALTEALQRGHLAGAGLDVTEPEPLPADHPLRQLDNVILTPHVAGVGFHHLPQTAKKIWTLCLDNVRRYQMGAPLRNVVDFSTGYRQQD